MHSLRVLLDLVSLGEWRGSLPLPRVAVGSRRQTLIAAFDSGRYSALIAIVLRNACR